MKNFNLKECGVSEISQRELVETNGGLAFLATIAAGILVGAAVAIINDWDNFIAGLTGKPEIK